MKNIFLFAVVLFIVFGNYIEKSSSFANLMRSRLLKIVLFFLAVLGSIVGLFVHLKAVVDDYRVSFDYFYFYFGMFVLFILSYYALPHLRPKDIWDAIERRLNPVKAFRIAFQFSPTWLKATFLVSVIYMFFSLYILWIEKGTANVTRGISALWIMWFIGCAGMLYPFNNKNSDAR